MARAYNFSPGPCGLPDAVMAAAQAEFAEYGDLQTSIMEVSHRGADFLRVYHETEHLLRELMGVPDNYWVLFLPGGATGHAAAIPLNLCAAGDTAAYVVTGYWSAKAAEEAKAFCKTRVVADTADANGKYISLPAQLDVPAGAVYTHYADNETIHGVEFPAPPASAAPLVADMSSNILSRQISVSDYGLIYAGAQKNMGPTGVTTIIVRADLVRPRAGTPSVLNYEKQQQAESMVNTPPTFQIYMVGLVLKWLKEQGGIAAIEKRNAEKAAALYGYLDSSDFYQTPAQADCRSRMNVPFFLPTEEQTAEFLRGAEALHLIGLKGHKAAGGCRASIYNAMPPEGVTALIEYMRDFEKRNG